MCDSDMYPNLSILLQIYGTITVTSCECERSRRVLKRLNTYLGASMGQERMSGLAFMHINQDVDIDEDEVKGTNHLQNSTKTQKIIFVLIFFQIHVFL